MVAPWISSNQPKKTKSKVGVDTAPVVDVSPLPENIAVANIIVEEVTKEVVEESIDLSKLLKTQLVVLAAAQGLDTSSCTKAQLIELLEA